VDAKVLASRVDSVVSTADFMRYKIAGNPNGIIDELLRRIESVVNSIKHAVSRAISDALGGVESAIRGITNALTNAVNRVVDGVGDIVDAIIRKLGDVVDALRDAFSDLVGELRSALTTSINALKDSLGDLVAAILGGIDALLTEVGDRIGDIAGGIRSGLENLVGAIRQTWEDVTTRIRELAERIAGAISEAYQEATERLRKALNDLLARLEEAVRALHDRLDAAFQAASEFINTRIMAPLAEEIATTRETLSFKVDVLKKAALGEYGSWDAFVSDLSDPPPAVAAVGAIVGGLMLTMVVAPALSTVIEPALANIHHLAAEKFRPELVTPPAAAQAVFRGLWSPGRAMTELGLAGYSDERARVLIEASRPIPSPGAVQEAFLRGFITEQEHDMLLGQHGYTSDDIRLFKALYFIIPPVQDIIRMAVREAFTPEIAKKFGQYEDFPEAFADWAEKQGLNRDWAERYWAAHWDLPSAQMGYEMLHRRIINEDELKMLLRALDVMPFWREKLIQLSYAPYTRIDVRRMYSLGILDEEGVYWSYRDLGYDDEKARNLTEFTVRYYAPEEETTLDKFREAGRTIYITAYKRGIITEEELRGYLTQLGYKPDDIELMVRIADAELAVSETQEDKIPLRTQTTNLVLDAYYRGLYLKSEVEETLRSLGYSDNEVNWYLALTEYRRTSDMRKLFLEYVHRLYIERTISKAEAAGLLGGIFPVGREQDSLFEMWDLEREARTRKPTEAQFRAALKAGIISREEYAEELRGLGFPEKYVEMLVKLTGV